MRAHVDELSVEAAAPIVSAYENEIANGVGSLCKMYVGPRRSEAYASTKTRFETLEQDRFISNSDEGYDIDHFDPGCNDGTIWIGPSAIPGDAYFEYHLADKGRETMRKACDYLAKPWYFKTWTAASIGCRDNSLIKIILTAIISSIVTLIIRGLFD